MKRDALFNMIEQQIRPWDVLDAGVLKALHDLPRAGFLPDSHKAFAYMDTELPLVIDGASTAMLLAPRLLARLVQELKPQLHESIAQVGLGDGYMAALIARFSRLLTVYEVDEQILKFAQANLNQHQVRNINYECADGLKSSDDAFDAIILAGSVAALPDAVKHKINLGGRIIAIIGRPDAPTMQATLFERLDTTQWRAKILFETTAPALSSNTQPHLPFKF